MTCTCHVPETVWEACVRRNNCRYGLRGVLVKRPFGPVESVAWSLWDQDTRLVLGFADGTRDRAEDCELRSKWPVVCCRPSRRRRRPAEELSPERRPMVTTTYRCDRCSAPITEGRVQLAVQLPKDRDFRDADLCPRCGDAFRAWLSSPVPSAGRAAAPPRPDRP
jgi:DNA-directed RNA polymerase subunit RPC12/RpoP